MRERLQSIGWVLLLLAVFTWFFHECLFCGETLLPTDMLHQLVPPYNESVVHPVVQNHYTMDAVEQDYPWGEFWLKSVRAGEVPLWNPAVSGGQPHLATSMAAVFSPFKLLFFWLGVERAWSLGIVLQFTLSAVFMFAFLRELGRSACASFVASCAFALNSNQVMWYWREAAVFLWVPLVLLLFERSTRKHSWSYTLAAGFVLGVAFLAGNVQSAVHVAFLCAVYWTLTVPWKDVASRKVAVLRVVVALFIGVCVAAVQWLPTLELMRNDVTGRVQTAGPRSGLYQTLLGIPLCITFVFNGLVGSTESYDVMKAIHASMEHFTAYIGVVPFTMFLIGAMDFRERRVRAWLIVAALVFGVIFFTPLLPYVYHRFFIVAIFGWTVIAAHGTDFVLDESRERTGRVRRAFLWMSAACVLLGVSLIFAQVFVHLRRAALLEAAQRHVVAHAGETFFGRNQQWLQDRVPLFFDHYRISNAAFWLPIGSIFVCAIAWRAFAQRRLTRGVLCVVLVVLTVGDLTASGRRIVPHVSLQEYPLYPPLPVLARAQADAGLFRIQRWPQVSGFLPDNILMAYGLNAASGYESLAPANLGFVLGGTNLENDRLLDLANVKYLIADRSANLPAERFELVADSPALRLYRNNHCLPRAQFVSNWEVIPDRARVLARMQADGFDPRKLVFIERDSPPGFPAPRANAGDILPPTTVQIAHYEDTRVAIHVGSPQAGVLVLADTFYPGWKASVDGQATPIYRADSVLRAVFVPAGGHEIEFAYRPLSFRVGATLTLSTTALVGLLILARVLLFKASRKPGLPLL